MPHNFAATTTVIAYATIDWPKRDPVKPSDFLRDLFAAELSRFETQLSASASGSFTCSPVDQPRIRRLALLDACHRSLHAVSFDDDAMWLGPEGKSHIALHAEVGARETAPVMTRIFLLAPRDRERYDTVLTAHAEAGVEVLTANPLDVPDLGRRDLVEIYDRAVLREATSSEGSEGGKYAEFTDDHARLKRGRECICVDPPRRKSAVGRVKFQGDCPSARWCDSGYASVRLIAALTLARADRVRRSAGTASRNVWQERA